MVIVMIGPSTSHFSIFIPRSHRQGEPPNRMDPVSALRPHAIQRKRTELLSSPNSCPAARHHQRLQLPRNASLPFSTTVGLLRHPGTSRLSTTAAAITARGSEPPPPVLSLHFAERATGCARSFHCPPLSNGAN